MLYCLIKFSLDHVVYCINRLSEIIKSSYAKVKRVVQSKSVDFEDYEQKLLGYPLYPIDDINYIVHIV